MTKDTNGKKVDTNLYRSIIGSLLYLTTSRPDIAFAGGVCARYQADPRTSHLHLAKRILKYISECTDDRKSTSGGCFFLGNNVAAWFSKKQNSVSLSTAEAEYIAVGSSCSQLLWMKQMLDEYGITQSSMILYCDNLSTISISKNPVQHSRTKHIEIRHHFIRELYEANIIRLEHVQSAFQLADIFIKPLDVATFEELRANVGILQRLAYINALYSEWLPLDSRSIHLVLKSIPSDEYSTVPSPEHISHAERSTNPPSPVTVALPRPSEHTKYSGTPSSQASPKTAPPYEADDEDDDSDDEDYAPRMEEKTEAEATSTSTENQSASPEKDPSDHQSTEELGESSIPRSTEGPSEFSTPVSTLAHVASSSGFRRPPTKGQRVVSTKAGRRKVPPNVSSIPIDGVSFHSEEGAHKWKYVVKRQIADEANIVDRYNFCPAILELRRNAGLIRTVSEVGLFYPRLMRELIVNLPSDFNDPSADEYQKVHIRGVCFNVSSELLNSYLGITHYYKFGFQRRKICVIKSFNDTLFASLKPLSRKAL
ncbi:flocculation protein FLO11-like [Cucumis melo var. makuwa]|uniref:Flocculation protein FLO11-like n=1 Tax=Cucumis melo var. makuwa TaxID=1194695 RepID=A0A5D3DM88_CUCMM|nr:flocculation protein FLO11-like [Cucumis melo var. makuwa]TYK24390.1 flocculation protein FLO11-like [Cucumis melo var. makuwa]